MTDSFFFMHQALAGDGSISVRVTSLTGLLPTPPAGRGAPVGTRPGLAPWAKAGLIIKASTWPGSAYAAVMVTGGHGVRMQYNYSHDTAGQPGPVSAASPRWLRLTRSGDTLTGAESADGNRWTTIGTAHLTGIPTTVQAGLFTTSPQYTRAIQSFGVAGDEGGPTEATAAFDHLNRQGAWPNQAWTGEDLGGPANPPPLQRGGFDHARGGFTVTGSGDIAPAVASAAGLGTTITQTLVGTFAGLIVLIVVATMFITAEYRGGLIRAVRDSATAIGVVLGLLYLFPILTQVVSDPHWRRHLKQLGPMTAGLAIQATTNLRGLPIGPWAGLGVLAAWAAAALLTGGLLLRLRDA